ncbi:MAG: MATE family efflux transporter, partial [Anaerolineaceae bacterium]|nr:MATE family efflux transporter [Anaerolineaceae bacterium]
MTETTQKAGVSSKIGIIPGRDWTKGSVSRNLLSLSWPLMISNVLTSSGPIIDMIWVGKLGSAAVAGVAVAYLLVQLLDAFKMGLDMGTRAMIAHFVGAGDSRGANHVALQGYVITIGFAAIVGTLGAILAGPILRMMGLTPEVVAQGAPYLRIQFIGILTMGLVWQNQGTMQFSGDTIGPMKIAFVYRIFHIVLCPFLVFGWWVFPRLGTSGAAYTGIISASLGAALGLWFLLSGRTRLRLNFTDFRPDAKMIWRIVKIGVPASVTGIERSLGQVLLVWFIVPFGTVATAAHALILQTTQLINITGSGLGQASAVLAGQNLGAKQPERAEKSGWLGVGLYTVILVISSLIVWFWGMNIISIFNNEPGVLEFGKAFLRIQIVTYMFSGCVLVLQQCLNGVGDTLTTMVVTLLGLFVVQLPLAFFLSQHTSLGVYGTYWAIAISTVVMAGIYATYFRVGLWKRK